MPRSEKTELKLELRKLLRLSDRYVDTAARLRVWDRGPDGLPRPAELLPRVYGGKYDRVERRYVGPADKIVEIPCHRGQLPLLLFDTPGVARVLALGPPRGGKTRAAIIKFLLLALDHPNETAGLVGPTGNRTKQTVWNDAIRVFDSFGWLDDYSKSARELYLANGVTAQVLAAKRSSEQYGNPLQGRDWGWAVVDESQNVDEDSQREIDARGGRWGTKYCVFETATNAGIGEFRERLELYRSQEATHKVIRFRPDQSPWIEPEFYDRLKSTMDEKTWRRFVNVEDVASDSLVYPSFAYARHVKQRSLGLVDVTSQLVQERYGRPAQWIVGTDFGVLVTASVFLKCYRDRARPNERIWYAHDEVTTYNRSADWHARQVLRCYNADDLILIADPHVNVGRADADKSDYNLVIREGLDIRPSAAGFGTITQKHRIQMMNAMLGDGAGLPHFFVAADEHGQATCHKLVRALLTQEWGAGGKEVARKDYRDVSHWPCAVEYGVFPWERIRGAGTLSVLPGGLGGRS